MRDYGKKKRERLPLITELFGLGFTCDEIAQAAHVSASTVHNDVRGAGGLRAFPSRPRGKEQKFSAAFIRYAEITNNVWPDASAGIGRETGKLQETLADFLQIEYAYGSLRGSVSVMERLIRPAYSQEQEHYYDLLCAVLHVSLAHASLQERETFVYLTSQEIWRAYLEDIRSKVFPAPSSIVELQERISDYAVQELRPNIAPLWPEPESNVVKHIFDVVLDKISEREQKIIRLRFGLTDEKKKMSLREVAEQFGIGHARIGQLEKVALRKLRHPARSALLRVLIKPVNDGWRGWVEYLFGDREEKEN